MRLGVGGLALAVILSVTACSKTEAPKSAAGAPASLSLAMVEDTHGVLPPQTVKIDLKADKKHGAYATDVAATPTWWVSGDEFKVVWYAGLSQTKRFFNMSNTTGDAKDQPDWLKNPETGVRNVKVAFDGGALQSVKPDTARASFKIPAGAKAVTEIQVAFGPEDAPQTLDWK
jgi:hypothetical protein